MLSKYTPAEAEAAFWSKVNKSGGPDACWPWLASRNPKGYGYVRWGGRMQKAHRVAWTLANGPIPDGLHVLHRCDNPWCCNVQRCLWLGTNAENVADMMAKGRNNQPRGAASGARLHPETRARGEANGCAVLTLTAVLDIRTAAAAGESLRGIARRIGVNNTTVSRVVRRETWGHVQ